ncbi:hypothetical protein SAMN04488564_12311 [Lentzea waywayandensis]|uniref:Uncharacterized protein n=1 Tax=Lentzea waywayandensis TaxID=84724 RepID=A0A1I6FIY4_9PSEU|nr:hypothetical protein SAMN04488564_12311 [Lentzea waywayandensis]
MDRLSGHFWITPDAELIIDELEGEAEMPAEITQESGSCRGGSTRKCAHLTSGAQ